MIRFVISVILLLLIKVTTAQNIKGSWYGRADVMVAGAASNYLTEFVLRQKGNEVEGVFAYYFKDTYQSFFVRGKYDPRTRLVSIRNIPLLFYASPTRTGIECPMHFEGKLIVSRVKSSINGTFYTEDKYKYTCPQLTVNMALDGSENQDSILKNTIVGKKFWQPQEEDVVYNAYDTILMKGIASVNSNAATVPSQEVAVQKEDADKKLIEEFGKRNNIYEKDIIVYDDSILVSFYDNGDIDDDTISVFLNKKPILIKRGLSARALNIYIGLDSTIQTHELSMFADNLGKFPPNTALMVISDRQKRYELYLSASMKQNSSVRLRRPRKE